jgi:glycerol kinase
MKYILAVDQGTTGSRAIVYDRKGRTAASAYEEFPQHFPRPDWVEHDPADIWRSVRRTIQKVLAVVPGSAIAAVGVTNQRETVFVWERATGRPVRNAIVWQCRRTSDRCRRLGREKGMAAFIRRKTGLPIDAYFSASKVEWILRSLRLNRTRAGRSLCFGTADSWVLWNLTGGAVHATDPTNASRTMLFDIGARRWDRDLLEIFGVPEGMMPEVRPSSSIFGSTVGIGALPAGIPIAGVAGDQQAALFGQACFGTGESKATYGTGCFILLNTGRMRVDSRHGLITTLACGPNAGTVFALEGSVFVAGAAVQWLRDTLGLMRHSAESEAMARAAGDNAGVYFVPAFVGLGAPYWDPDARGAIVGLTRASDKNHLVRASLEAMAYSARDVLETMRKDAHLRITSLRVDGGAVANDFLCQFQADVLGIPVVRPETIETTSLGAAYLAGLATGYWESAGDIVKLRAAETVFKPTMKRARAEDLYRGWKGAVRRTLSTPGSYAL